MTARVLPNGLLFSKQPVRRDEAVPLVRIAALLCKAQPVLSQATHKSRWFT
jgi:hypothetical protein